MLHRIETISIFAVILVALNACQLPNHFLIHPHVKPPDITEWEENITRGMLSIHLAWAKPAGEGPFPTILVHPHGGKTTDDLKGVVWDLASHGYLAVAIDYKVWLDGEYQRNTFVWSDKQDSTYALEYVRASRFADPDRIVVMGFSQGGRMSLLIAAHARDQVDGVIAYYPIVDFNGWFDTDERNFMERWVFKVIRGHFYRHSGADSEEAFQKVLYDASPLNHVENIKVPVLLVHGDADTSVRIQQSQRLKQSMENLNKPVELLIVPGGVHIFNFRQQQKAQFAWEKTISWLDRLLK